MKCASFDVFDTCLVRRVVAPTEVFRQVGRQLAEQTGQPRPEEFAEQFVAWRCEAEKRARRHSPREDISLGDIWEELQQLAGGMLPADRSGPAREMAEEERVLGASAVVRERVAQARVSGLRIVFISDMYLPTDFIRRCLARQGLLEDGDGLYVSGDVGLTKQSGNLFRHVLARENLAPGEMSHLGDHPAADRDIPRRLGIQAELFTGPEAHAVEGLFLQRRLPAVPAYVETAGRIRFARLASPPTAAADPAVRSFVESFLGPVLCLFAHWILERARSDGVTQLYFVSRDARLAWAVCRKIAAASAPPVDCRYLLLSRQAIYLPSSAGISAAGMPWLRPGPEGKSLATVAASLELDCDQVALAWRRHYPTWAADALVSTPEQWDKLWATLAAPEFADPIRRAVERRRAAALAYFEGEGLLAADAPAIVDLGSLLYCQEALNRVCAEKRGPRPIRGYYLYLMPGRRGPAEAGPAEAFCYQPAVDLPLPDHLRWLHRTAVLEHVAGIADHPSVRAYEADGRASLVSAAGAIAPARFQQLEAALLDYAGTFGDCWKPVAGDPGALGMLSTIINDFLECPSPAALAFLAELTFPADPAHQALRPLVEPYTWAEIARALLPAQNGAPAAATERIWPEAGLQATARSKRYARTLAGWARRASRRLGRE